VNEPAMPAHPAKTHLLVVANARHSPRYGCALRLDRARFDGLLGHAEFIRTFCGFEGFLAVCARW